MYLVTPFTNKLYAIPLWLENFKQLDLPRSEIDLVWLDLSTDPLIKQLLRQAITAEGPKFKSVRFIENVEKVYPIYTAKMPKVSSQDFQNKRRSVAETMNILFSYVEGDTLLWEDDILVPTNAYTKLKQVFDWSDDIYGATVVQYSRDTNTANELLHWYWSKHSDQPIILQKNWEKAYGIESIGSSASGFTFYAGEFLRQHTFFSQGIYGQDVMTGYAIRKLNKLLLLDWSIKSIHIGYTKNYIRLYCSKMCATKVALPQTRTSGGYNFNQLVPAGIPLQTSLVAGYQPRKNISLLVYNVSAATQIDDIRNLINRSTFFVDECFIVPRDTRSYAALRTSRQPEGTVLKTSSQPARSITEGLKTATNNVIVIDAAESLGLGYELMTIDINSQIAAPCAGVFNHTSCRWNITLNQYHKEHGEDYVLSFHLMYLELSLAKQLSIAPALGTDSLILGFHISAQLWSLGLKPTLLPSKQYEQHLTKPSFAYSLGVLAGREIPLAKLHSFITNTVRPQGILRPYFNRGLRHDLLDRIIGRKRHFSG